MGLIQVLKLWFIETETQKMEKVTRLGQCFV